MLSRLESLIGGCSGLAGVVYMYVYDLCVIICIIYNRSVDGDIYS